MSDGSGIIVSISSDIGLALADHYLERGYRIAGTYRTSSAAVQQLGGRGATLFQCDVASNDAVDATAGALARETPPWNFLIFAPGVQDPIGLLPDVDFDEWDRSVKVNFVNQLRFVHRLLGTRNRNSPEGPLVLFFAGGGTNSASTHYSAYTISKIALIKMTELLDAEVPDCRFTILGPGWVRTKIHEQTIRAGERAGMHSARVREKLKGSDWVPMEKVISCCDWVLSAPRDVVSGRNFSVASDAWGDARLSAKLREDPNMYKLRRLGNDWR